MHKNLVFSLLRYAAIAGNVVYILWILWNGIGEGFKASPVQIVSYIGILILLTLNAVLLVMYKKVSGQ